MNKEKILKGKVQIKNKWFETKEDELDIALNVIDDLLIYIKQLETNREEAIEYINTQVDDLETDSNYLIYQIKEIKEMLERGKE